MNRKHPSPTIGQQIRHVRESADLTQEEMVAEINRRRPKVSRKMTQGHLSAMENDRHVPTLSLLYEIAKAAGHRLCERLFVGN